MTVLETPPSWIQLSFGMLWESSQNGCGARRGVGLPTVVLRLADVTTDGIVASDGLREISLGEEARRKFALTPGDLLVFRVNGSPHITGKMIAYAGPAGYAFCDHFIRLRIDQTTAVPAFVAMGMSFGAPRRLVESGMVSTAGQNTVSQATLREIPILLPPVPEQRRIVDALDSYLSRLGAAVATLEAARAKLKAYRASVLKSAVRGCLVPTEAALARAEKRNFEGADVLLKRILSERRRRWEEAELARLKAAGKSPKDEKWKAKYEEPKPPDTTDLPPLSEGWCWASPSQVASDEDYALAIGPFGSNLKVSDYTSSGTPLVFVRNIRACRFHDGAQCVSQEKAEELKAHWIEGGDILITKMGDPPGDCCRYPASRPQAIITADCIKLRLNAALTHIDFFLYSIRSSTFQRQIQAVTKGVAQKKISLERFRPLAIPMAPPAEQGRIVDEIERLDSVATGTMDDVDRCLSRIRRLRQSVLKWAFEGKLVDQDPNNEPAGNLLDRLRAGRSNAETPKSSRQVRKAQ